MPSTAVQGLTSTNTFVRALEWGWQWTDGAAPGTNITYYFQGGGEDLSGLTGGFLHQGEGWQYRQ
jgi:hypothetical protein